MSPKISANQAFLSTDPSFHTRGMTYEYVCSTCSLALLDPHQTSCGLRICGPCLRRHLKDKGDPAPCPCGDKECGAYFSLTLDEYKTVVPDYPLRKELKQKKIPCRYKHLGCKAELKADQLEEHQEDCQFGAVDCDYRTLGCQAKLKPNQKQDHLRSCDYTPKTCHHCKKTDIAAIFMKDHIKNECMDVKVGCPNKCGVHRMLRKNLDNHLAICRLRPQNCPFQIYGCNFKGTEEEVNKHCTSNNDHIPLTQKYQDNITKQHQEREQKMEEKIQHLEHAHGRDREKLRETQKVVANQGQTILTLEREIKQLKQSMNNNNTGGVSLQRVQHLGHEVTSLENKRSELESDMRILKEQLAKANQKLTQYDLRFQVLETASYDGTLLWKIKDYSRRKQDAIQGGILSLYSQAFYTGRHGYRLCARVYLNGDGIGAGTHLSLFFVVMRGEYDALLPWPFRCKVSLMLLDQVGRTRNIADTFRPDPSSSSFQRPARDMNIASGCPLFVSHEVLEAKDSIFLKDDTLFIKVVVDTENLQTA